MTKDHIRGQNRRSFIQIYKQLLGCQDCGYTQTAEALEFDHRPGTDKVRNVGSLFKRSWKVIFDEINKCDIVCANCHAIRTSTRYYAQVAEWNTQQS